MTHTQSQAIKNQAAAMRRTATAVRNLAAAGTTTESECRTLSAAAAIFEAKANMAAQRAKQVARDEKAYEAARNKALPLAQAAARTLPMETTAQKLAVLTEGHNAGYMLNTIHGHYPGRDATPAIMQRELTDALAEIARSLAHTAALRGRPPEIPEHMLQRLARQAQNPEIVAAAKLFDQANATATAPC